MRLTKNGKIPGPQRRKGTVFGGFTLIELLIVVAIIGIIAAILVPNLLDAMQKAKQRKAMTDMHIVGTAWMAWLSDAASAAAAGRGTAVRELDFASEFSVVTYDDVVEMLVPRFALEIPTADPWASDYEFRVAEDAVDAVYPFGMRSSGADSAFDSDTYQWGKFMATDYSQDIVWAAGYFVRLPGGVTIETDS